MTYHSHGHENSNMLIPKASSGAHEAELQWKVIKVGGQNSSGAHEIFAHFTIRFLKKIPILFAYQ
jgi:hypothetical protein